MQIALTDRVKQIVFYGSSFTAFNVSKPDWFFEMNPLGKAPVIELPDGKVLYQL